MLFSFLSAVHSTFTSIKFTFERQTSSHISTFLSQNFLGIFRIFFIFIIIIFLLFIFGFLPVFLVATFIITYFVVRRVVSIILIFNIKTNYYSSTFSLYLHPEYLKYLAICFFKPLQRFLTPLERFLPKLLPPNFLFRQPSLNI